MRTMMLRQHFGAYKIQIEIVLFRFPLAQTGNAKSSYFRFKLLVFTVAASIVRYVVSSRFKNAQA